MATGTFCDRCNQELDSFNTNLRRTIPVHVGLPEPAPLWVNFQVSTSPDYVEHFGDVCRNCVWEAIDQMDPRKPEPDEPPAGMPDDAPISEREDDDIPF